MNKLRFLELLSDDNNRLSTSRFISLLFALTAVTISVILACHGIIINEYNILVGLLISGAVGNKFVGNSKNSNSEQSITTEKN